MRHAVACFLAATGVAADTADDILTAVGEARAIVMEHAYDPACPSDGELHARFQEHARLAIDVFDRGQFVRRDARPGRGFGLRIVRAIAREVSIDTHDGTRLRMVFDAPVAQAVL